MTSECLILEDCRAWYELGIRNSGVFSINPDYGEPFQVSIKGVMWLLYINNIQLCKYIFS